LTRRHYKCFAIKHKIFVFTSGAHGSLPVFVCDSCCSIFSFCVYWTRI